MTVPDSSPATRPHPRVSVVTNTYNHEHYIAQAVESALMQKAQFDYEILIGEDCSSDSTRKIVCEYAARNPSRIRLLLHPSNVGGPASFKQLLAESRGEFVSILEGDDYWTCPDKLQKQVSFLDLHPECALCFHNALRIYEDGSRVPVVYTGAGQTRISALEDLWQHNFIATCTAMFRKDVLGDFPEWYYDLPLGDWALWILCAQYGKIGYIDEILGVHRIHSRGLWSGLDSIQKLEGLIAFYETMNANLDFRFNDIVEHWVSARRKQLAGECALVEAAQRTLPPASVVIVMSRAYDDPPPLKGHQVWAFPDPLGKQTQRHFASGSVGSAEAPWIGADATYDFRLFGGVARDKLLASVTVRQNATPLCSPVSDKEPRKSGAFIEASPNPVPPGTKYGKTTINWSTGDGSPGIIYVALEDQRVHYPANSGEAIEQLETLRAKGGEFLLVPRKLFSWLEEYVGLKEHLDSHYRLAQGDETCLIYDLREMPSGGRLGMAAR